MLLGLESTGDVATAKFWLAITIAALAIVVLAIVSPSLLIVIGLIEFLLIPVRRRVLQLEKRIGDMGGE